MAAPTPAALVVIHSFGIYSKGDLISDAAAIKSILDGGLSSFVVPTTLPPAPKPAASGG